MNIETILERLEPIPECGCYVWTGGDSGIGYGSVWFNGRPRRVHRVVYEHFNGPIPEGMQIDHLCRNRACSNVHHLEVVTNQENCLRGKQRITHCPSGHMYSQENTRIKSDSGSKYRVCKACTKVKNARYHAAVKAQRLLTQLEAHRKEG